MDEQYTVSGLVSLGLVEDDDGEWIVDDDQSDCSLDDLQI